LSAAATLDMTTSIYFFVTTWEMNL
jgi:hypothetical protein